MNQKVFIQHVHNGVPANAYAVRLANEGTADYGIKRADTGAIVVPYNTSVTNPETGRYEYDFSGVQPGIVYTVSWEITPFNGANPQYRVETVGPFYEQEEVRVRPETKGTFTQGTFGAIYLKLYDTGGSPTDASTISVRIVRASDQEEIVDEKPVKLGRGIYLFDWQVPGDAEVGTYDVIWTYAVRGATHVEHQQVEVAEATDNAVATGIMALMRIKLEAMLSGIQAINLNMLQADDTPDLRTYGFPFPRWNQSAGVKVYRNQKLIRTGYEIDYLNGLIIFNRKQLEQDQIHVSCVFRFFSDEDLDFFLLQGLNAFNIFPPHTGAMTYANIPQHYVPPVMYGAAVEGIRTFMQALIWPKNRALFETGEAADKAFDHYNTIKENYEKQWQTLSEQKKLFPYAGLHRLVLQPQYNLPGGRARFYRYLFGGGF